jgi:hypothetical protein
VRSRIWRALLGRLEGTLLAPVMAAGAYLMERALKRAVSARSLAAAQKVDRKPQHEQGGERG